MFCDLDEKNSIINHSTAVHVQSHYNNIEKYKKWCRPHPCRSPCKYNNSIRIVYFSTQAMYLRVTTPQQQQHHHHQTRTPTSSSLFSVVSGPRGCQQQRTGGEVFKLTKQHSCYCCMHRSIPPCTYVKLPNPRLAHETQLAVCLVAHIPTPQKRHQHHHPTATPVSNRLLLAVPGLHACCGSGRPLYAWGKAGFAGRKESFLVRYPKCTEMYKPFACY